MRRITGLLASLALVLTMAPVTLAAPQAGGTWIVTLRGDADPHASSRALLRAHGGELRFVYEHAINGFAFRGSSAAAAAIQHNPNVASVEADAEVWLETTQTGATWGLDRIDQRSLPLDGSFSYGPTGADVTAYVIDSGIRFSHQEFAGRARPGVDVVGGIEPAGSDCNSHGTHVAGTIGGETYGVAKDVELVSVRIFGCGTSSSWSVIIEGIDWVIQDHRAGEPAVANMSLTGPATSSVDAATTNLINDGVAVALAAGNGNWLGLQANACNYSPARVNAAMTISATQSNDAKVSWANYGSCVDWFAPGVGITSAGIGSDSATASKSGTSMASPHTAGVAALYLDANPTASPAAVRDAIYEATTKGVVTSSSTPNNHLLYSGFLGGVEPEPPTDEPPQVSIDSPAAGTTLSGTATISASASDDAGVGSVAFYYGDTLIGTDASAAGGWSTSWDTTSVPDGPYSLSAVATDTGNQSTTSSFVPVTVTNGGGGGTTFSLALSGSSGGLGNTWTSTVSITARDALGAPLSDVTVTGSWSNGGTASCVTGSSGSCEVSRQQHKRVGSVTYTVTGASHGSLTWDGGPDSVTVPKP